jgi:hypothetical protein
MRKRMYPNACEMKMKNKRVAVCNLDDKHLGLLFTRLCDSPEEANCTDGLIEVEKDKIKITRVILSNESAFALYQALGEIITLDRIPQDCLTLDIPCLKN